MMVQLLTLISIFFLSVCGCASQATIIDDKKTISSPPNLQFFLGTIQSSSKSGQVYGPPVESLVRRKITKKGIIECVFQNEKAFIVELKKTSQNLVYSVTDFGGSSAGVIRFETDLLESWSYDINVLKPNIGKITGDLLDGYGGRIYPDGEMKIIKVWNNMILISESYESISESEYIGRLPLVTPKDMVEIVSKRCR